MVIYGYEFAKGNVLLCYYEEDVGLLVGLHQLSCMEIYCYVELYRPMSGSIKQCRAVEPWHA